MAGNYGAGSNAFTDSKNYEYFRYVDDIRIFTRTYEDARRSLFKLEEELRKLGLNIQNSKTKILSYDEAKAEFSDPRIDLLTELNEKIRIAKADGTFKSEKKKFGLALKEIRNQAPPGRPNFRATKQPLSGLTSRAFRMWVNTSLQADDRKFVHRLVSEVMCNPDPRLTRALHRAFSHYPNNTAAAEKLLQFIKSGDNVFDYQKAEILRAVRVVGKVPDAFKTYCIEEIEPPSDAYLAYQAALLLQRFSLNATDRIKVEQARTFSDNPRLQIALSCVLFSAPESQYEKIVRWMEVNQSKPIRDFLLYLRSRAVEEKQAMHLFSRALNGDNPQLTPNYVGILQFISVTGSPKVKKALAKKIEPWDKKHKIIGLRETLASIKENALAGL